jgi:hypothetical protein
VQVAQELVHPDRPCLLGIAGIWLDNAEQLAEVMDVAEGVLEVGVVAIGLEPVVNRDPGEVGEHTGVIEAIEPALVMQRVERRVLGACAEQPAQLASARAPVSSKCATGEEMI